MRLVRPRDKHVAGKERPYLLGSLERKRPSNAVDYLSKPLVYVQAGAVPRLSAKRARRNRNERHTLRTKVDDLPVRLVVVYDWVVLEVHA